MFDVLARFWPRVGRQKTRDVTLAAAQGFSATLDRTVIRGNTGRATPVADDYSKAEAWSKLPVESLTESTAANRFRKEVRGVASAPIGVQTLFRGRRADASIRGWQNMGPPPPEQARADRYNVAGQVVLYLATSIEGVRLEIARDGWPICVQTYLVDLRSRPIADVASATISDFIKAVFDRAEAARCTDYGRQDYAFGQVLAGFVREAGFGGMLVPGVRGHPKHRYSNVAVFDPHPWKEWSAREAGFQKSEM